MDIVTYDEAFSTVLTLAALRRMTSIDVWQSHPPHRLAAVPVTAAIDMPPFARSMMDGYAIHADDLATDSPLTVIDNIHAGEASRRPVTPGTAVQVRTGAPIPSGTSAIVRNEWIERSEASMIRLLQKVKLGESIQWAGEDARAGDVILPMGSVVDGQARSVLRAAGVKTIPAFSACRVAVICTGTELLREHTLYPRTGQVFASSDAFLSDALRFVGAEVEPIEYVRDDVAAIEQAIVRYVNEVDYILVTGGASVGDTDFAKVAIARVRNSAEPILTRVWMRPGAPFLAARSGKTTIFGMSGNPAACFVQFHVLALPAIKHSMGYPQRSAFPFTASLAQPLTLKPVKHVRFHRAVASFDGTRLVVSSETKQSSGSLTGLTFVNAIMRLDQSQYPAGKEVPLLFTRPLLESYL